jgi:hypothetical protein
VESISDRGQVESAVVGGPREIADAMEELFANQAATGSW